MTAARCLALGLVASAALAAPASAGADMIWPSSRYFADALVNMQAGPYAEEGNLTAGGARPWYDSPVVARLYGGVPDAEQRRLFTAGVITRVIDSYRRSGMNLTLTDNPSDGVPHTLSVVSGTYAPSYPEAVGLTTVGGSGFTFIDSLKYANSVDELERAVAHNVSHELMHAFGGDHHDTSGLYLDAGVTQWSTLVDPGSTFSGEAVAQLMTKDFRAPSASSYWALYGAYGAQQLSGADAHSPGCGCARHGGATLLAPVPEPSSIALFGLGGLALLARGRRRARAGRAA